MIMQLYWKQMQIQNIEKKYTVNFFLKVIVILIVTAANLKKNSKISLWSKYIIEFNFTQTVRNLQVSLKNSPKTRI